MTDDDNANDPLTSQDRSSLAYRIVDGLVKVARYLLVLLIVPAGLLLFWPPFEQRDAAMQKLENLNARHETLLQKKAIMQEELNLIRNNDEYLEIRARDRLHLQKDGEIVMQFEKPGTPVPVRAD